MKVLKITGIVLVVIVLIVVILGFIAPKDYKVERSIVIPTDNKEVVFKNISNWKEFLKWNPWSSLDPNQKLTFSGEEGKVGSGYAWDGNDDVGAGSMTITTLVENERVESDLHFLKPMESKNKTLFSMTPEGDGIKVTWLMSGSSGFPFNVIGLFMNMDKMIGKDFEKGLESLKTKCLAEAVPSAPAADTGASDTTTVAK